MPFSFVIRVKQENYNIIKDAAWLFAGQEPDLEKELSLKSDWYADVQAGTTMKWHLWHALVNCNCNESSLFILLPKNASILCKGIPKEVLKIELVVSLALVTQARMTASNVAVIPGPNPRNHSFMKDLK